MAGDATAQTRTVVITGMVYLPPGDHPHPHGSEVVLPAAHADELVAAGGAEHKAPPTESAPATA